MDLSYGHFYFVIKTSIKLVRFFNFLFYFTFLWHFYQITFTQVFFFASIIVQLLLQMLVDAGAVYLPWYVWTNMAAL